MKRIISIDCGRGCSGVVIFEDGHLIHMDCVTSNLMEYCETRLKEFIIPHHTLMIYENLWMPKMKRSYANWPLMKIQKTVRKFFESHKCTVKALLPSQKVSMVPGEFSKDRKKRSEESCRVYLKDVGGSWLDTFERYPRRHDIADALLAALYMMR